MKSFSQDHKSQILEILKKQEDAWNSGRLEKFMEGYWQSDSLIFVGSDGLTYGYDRTLARYKSSYPDRKAMGKLNFTILEVRPLGGTNYLLIGKWELKRESDRLAGFFSLTWALKEAEWVIIADHSS